MKKGQEKYFQSYGKKRKKIIKLKKKARNLKTEQGRVIHC